MHSGVQTTPCHSDVLQSFAWTPLQKVSLNRDFTHGTYASMTACPLADKAVVVDARLRTFAPGCRAVTGPFIIGHYMAVTVYTSLEIA